MDRQKILEFWKKRSKISDDYEASRNGVDNRLEYDLNLIKKYIGNQSIVLDLGCGTGVVSLAIADMVFNVTSVDYMKNFLERIDHPKITCFQSDILDFNTSKSFDLILLFGVFNYFNLDEIKLICIKLQKWIKRNGVIIIKHQCGVDGDILIDKISDELKTHYIANYRYINYEIDLLKTFFNVDVVDIYPDKLNKWNTTHHYAFICTPMEKS